MSARSLRGRIAVVTGVTAGIGRATAERLLAAGATVVGCARDEERLDVVAGRLPGLQVRACDVRDPGQRAALVTAVLTRHGRVDVLVSPVADLVVRRASQRLARAGRELADSRTGRYDRPS